MRYVEPTSPILSDATRQKLEEFFLTEGVLPATTHGEIAENASRVFEEEVPLWKVAYMLSLVRKYEDQLGWTFPYVKIGAVTLNEDATYAEADRYIVIPTGSKVTHLTERQTSTIQGGAKCWIKHISTLGHNEARAIEAVSECLPRAKRAAVRDLAEELEHLGRLAQKLYDRHFSEEDAA